MNRMNTRKYKLLQAVLASGCLIMPGVVFGDCYINNNPNQGTCNDPPYNGPPYVFPQDNITVTITGDGQIHQAGPGLDIIGNNNTVDIQSGPGVPLAIESDDDGIQIHGANATINIGNNRAIEADYDGITTTAANTIINNSGGIQGSSTKAGNQAIEIDVGATNAIINNLSTGVIYTNNANADAIQIREKGATITNSGEIISAQGNFAIDVQKSFKNITNNAGGLIESVGDGIIVNGADVTGDIINSGTIQTTGVNRNAITIWNNFSGNINNLTTGVIQTTNAGSNGEAIFIGQNVNNININNSGKILATNTAEAIWINGNVSGNINNNLGGQIISEDGTTIHLADGLDGSISNAGEIGSTNDAIALEVASGTITGDITNAAAGTIVTGNSSAIYLNNTTIDGLFTNSGEILNDSAGNATISANGATTIPEHFINTGTIENLAGAGSHAIDFSGANVNVKLIQNGGTITGDVQLSDAGGEVFDLNGGKIDGDVLGGAGDDIMNINGGEIEGNVLGGAGNDIVNITGGSYGSLDGGGGKNILNIDSTFTTTGPVSNFQTINANAGNFTVEHPITDVHTKLNIESGASVIASGLGKIIDGNGDLEVKNGGSLSIHNGSNIGMGSAVFRDGSSLEVELLNETDPPFVDVIGNTVFENGSTLHAIVGGVPVSNGASYDILSSANINDQGLLVTDSSATLSFSKDPTGLPNILRIIANVIPFNDVVSGSEITDGVANTLDNILSNGTNNQDLNDLIGQLQTLGTAEEVENALRMLVPNYNHSLAANSIFAVHRAFDDIGIRLEELLGLYPLLQDSDVYRDDEDERSYNYYNRYGYGYNYGDGDGSPLMRHRVGSWVKPYASIIDQRKRETVEGYKADSVGVSAGADWRILDWATIGVAFNYGKTDVTQRGMFENKQKINSYQLTFYGHFDPMGPIYVNTLLGLGRHGYKTDRAISIGTVNQVAQADFHALHYAAKLEIGYAWFNGKYYVSPLASMRYTRLEFDNYTDDGAGGLNLSTRYEPVTELLGSLGIKLAMKNEYLEAVYVPELAAYINYDFQQDRQETLNNFLGGGPSFKSFGIKPAQTSFIVSPSLRLHSYRNFMFKIAYEFEAKKQFIAHSAYLKWYYKWD